MPLATEQFTCLKCNILFTLTRTSDRKSDLRCDKSEWKKRCKHQPAVDGLAPAGSLPRAGNTPPASSMR